MLIGCLFLFQLANASLAPLVSGRLAYDHRPAPVLFTSAIILIPQIVAAATATWIGRRAEDWGRKPLLLIGLAALSVRAVLFAVVAGPWVLLPLQLLDGLSAGLIGVLIPLAIADLTRGTGRYNLAQGYAGTAVGIGAALSVAGSGFLVEHGGYAASFLALAAIGLAGFAMLYKLLPETKPGGTDFTWARLLHYRKASA